MVGRLIKNILLLIIIGVLVGSCAPLKNPPYILVNGECQPTEKNVIKMIKIKNQTGIDYVWFECEWTPRKTMDSIIDVRLTMINNKMMKDY